MQERPQFRLPVQAAAKKLTNHFYSKDPFACNMILKDFHDHYNNRYQFCPKLFPEQLTHTHRHCLELKTKIICMYLSILSQNAPFFNTLRIGLIFCPLYTACVHIHLLCTLYVLCLSLAIIIAYTDMQSHTITYAWYFPLVEVQKKRKKHTLLGLDKIRSLWVMLQQL